MNRKFYFFLLTPVILLLFFIHTRGFIPHDEGWFLQAGLRFLYDQIPYKDFDYFYNPGSLYLNALGFKLFGETILASRLIALANSLIAIIFLLKISQKLRLTLFTTSLFVLLYTVWGPGHINFVWPVIFCVTLAIASFYFHLTGKRQFTLGLLAGLTFILKQNFGVAIILVNLLFKNRLRFLLGLATILTIQLSYFLATNSLIPYINEQLRVTVAQVIQGGVLNSPLPWQYPAPLPYQIGKLIFYLSPVIFSAFSFRKYPYISLLTTSYYLSSIRPTTDIIHLAPLVALSALSLALANKKFVLLALVLVGLYSSVFKNYYRWNTPLANQTTLPHNPRAQILVDSTSAKSINALTTYFQTHTENEKYLFIYNFAPIFYFLLNKNNPTPYDYLHPGVLNEEVERNVIRNLAQNHVRYLLVNTDLPSDPSLIAKYILLNFQPVQKINEYTVFAKSAQN